MDKQESLSQGSEGGLLTDLHPFLFFVSQLTFLSQMKILVPSVSIFGWFTLF